MNALLLAALAAELDPLLVGARLDRAQQPTPLDLLFTFHKPERDVQLLVAVHPDAPRLHLVAGNPSPGKIPSAFCMLLRKHIEGQRVTGLRQPPLDRVLILEFASKAKLIIRMTGRSANLILMQHERCLGALRSARPPYLPPPSKKLSPLMVPGPAFALRLAAAPADAILEQWLTETFAGVTVGTARRITAAAGIPAGQPAGSIAPPVRERLAAVWGDFWDRLRRRDFAPTAVYDALGALQGVLPWPEEGAAAPTARAAGVEDDLPPLSALLNRLYQAGAGSRDLEEMRRHLLRIVDRSAAKAAHTLAVREQELAEAGRAERWKQIGDLILTHAAAIPARSASADLEDLGADPPGRVSVDLDPHLTPFANADRYYQRARKGRRAVGAVALRVAESRLEMDYLDQVRWQIHGAEDRPALEEIEAELVRIGLAPPPQGAPQSKRGHAQQRGGPAAAGPRIFRPADGYELRVGRNNLQNDQLTLHWAKSGDWWFHIRQIPGAHVILRGPGGSQEPPPEVLLNAARLAAHYSAARNAGKAEVDYTRVKHVKKPPGAKPGMVTYSHEHTLRVESRSPEDLQVPEDRR